MPPIYNGANVARRARLTRGRLRRRRAEGVGLSSAMRWLRFQSFAWDPAAKLPRRSNCVPISSASSECPNKRGTFATRPTWRKGWDYPARCAGSGSRASRGTLQLSCPAGRTAFESPELPHPGAQTHAGRSLPDQRGGRGGIRTHGRFLADARFRVECLKPDSATLPKKRIRLHEDQRRRAVNMR
jgi:hypothetical protein